jgi:hypothetical protein
MEDFMATRTSAAKKPATAARKRPAAKAQHEPDVIRIVPLHVVEDIGRPTAEAAAAGPAAAPHLTYRNGPLIANVEVFTIFWGAAWNGAQSALRTTVNQFFDFVLASPLIDQLSEYSVPKFKIGHGKHTGTVTVTSPAPHHSVSDAALQAFLKAEIAKNASVPKPGPNTLYFIYAPPGVRIVQGGSASCQAFCGYHNDIGGSTFYAIMPFPGCQGCRGALSTVDALTSTSSHELCEAITDPVPGQGWYDDTNGEIGDICAWKTKTLGSFCVQLEWSNKAGKCV